MGQEFAQTKEWNEAVALSWELLDFPEHEGMRQFVKKLNEIYNTYDAMYYNDCDPMGFEWMSCDDNENSVVSFVRRGSKAKDQLLFIYNLDVYKRQPHNNLFMEVLSILHYLE